MLCFGGVKGVGWGKGHGRGRRPSCQSLGPRHVVGSGAYQALWHHIHSPPRLELRAACRAAAAEAVFAAAPVNASAMVGTRYTVRCVRDVAGGVGMPGCPSSAWWPPQSPRNRARMGRPTCFSTLLFMALPHPSRNTSSGGKRLGVPRPAAEGYLAKRSRMPLLDVVLGRPPNRRAGLTAGGDVLAPCCHTCLIESREGCDGNGSADSSGG